MVLFFFIGVSLISINFAIDFFALDLNYIGLNLLLFLEVPMLGFLYVVFGVHLVDNNLCRYYRFSWIKNLTFSLFGIIWHFFLLNGGFEFLWIWIPTKCRRSFRLRRSSWPTKGIISLHHPLKKGKFMTWQCQDNNLEIFENWMCCLVILLEDRLFYEGIL